MGSMMPLAPPPGAPNPNAPPPPPAGAPNGPSILPSPATPPSPTAMRMVTNVHNIATSLHDIASTIPGAIPTVEKMNSLLSDLQREIMKGTPPPQVAAPPV